MRLRQILTFIGVGILLCVNSSVSRAQQDLPPEVVAYADLVLYNGKVLTADETFSIAQAVAVRDEKILAVGDTDRILKMAGPKTVRIDLHGNTMTPGFINVHSIPVPGGHGTQGVDYLGNYFTVYFEDLDTGLRKIKANVDKVPPGQWVFMTSIRTKAAYQMTLQLLDQASPNNPLMINLDNTTGIVNSRALAVIPDDVRAGIYKDTNGKPTGRIAGWAYGVLTYEVVPYPEGDLYQKYIQQAKQGMEKWRARGVTTTGGRASGLQITLAHELYSKGELPIRLRVVSEIARLNPNFDRYVKRVGNLMDVGNEWFKIAGMTVSSIDSVATVGGILTRKPKLNSFGYDPFGPYGQNKFADMVSPNEGQDWKEYSDYKNALLAAKYGWNVTDAHVMGDAAVELMLEVWDISNKDKAVKDRRFGFVHGTMRPQDLLKRLAGYNATLSFRPDNFQGEYVNDLEKTYGGDAVAGMLPVRDVIDAGLKPVLEVVTRQTGTRDVTPGRDFTSPGGFTYRTTQGYDQNAFLATMQAFITRKNDMTGKVWGAQQKITRQEALKMGTAWGATFYGDQDIIGTIEPGKLADFVVLGGDYLTVPEDEISRIPILKVVLGGKVFSYYEETK